jgi:type II secretory pathway pseudopilin PulG
MSSKRLLYIGNEVGATLLENLLATAIIGIGLAGFASLSGNLSIVGDKSSQKSIATTIAQDKIEEIKNLSAKIELPGFESLTSPVYSGGVWSETQGENVDSEGVLDTSEAEYQRSWVITPDPDRNRLFNLRVDVSYTDRSSNSQTLTMNTQISQNKQVASADIIEFAETPDDDVEADDPVNNVVAVQENERTCPNGAQGFEDGFGNWCCNNMGMGQMAGGQMAGGQMAGGQMMIGGAMACGD